MVLAIETFSYVRRMVSYFFSIRLRSFLMYLLPISACLLSSAFSSFHKVHTFDNQNCSLNIDSGIHLANCPFLVLQSAVSTSLCSGDTTEENLLRPFNP